jgi:hypothetical protein
MYDLKKQQEHTARRNCRCRPELAEGIFARVSLLAIAISDDSLFLQYGELPL